MENNKKLSVSDRRNFFSKFLAAGTVMCLGCPGLSVLSAGTGKPQSSLLNPDKSAKTGQESVEPIRFAVSYSVPLFRQLEKEIGKDKLIEMLKKASAANMSELMASVTKDITERNMKNFSDLMTSLFTMPPYDQGFKYEITENNEKVFEMKYIKCPMAEAYKELNATDIGYAIECSPMDAMVKAYNPKMKGIEKSNLMKGDSTCIERFEMLG